MRLKWRRWLACLAAVSCIGSCAVLRVGSTSYEAQPVTGRPGETRFWLYDSTGNRLSDVDSGTVKLFLSQVGDTTGSTVWAAFDSAGGSTWVAVHPDTSDIFKICYASTLHAYCLLDSFPWWGIYVPKASIHGHAFIAGCVPESALAEDIICPRHINTDSSFVLALDTLSTIHASVFPNDILWESEYRAWWTAVAAESLDAGLYDADFDTLVAAWCSLGVAEIDTLALSVYTVGTDVPKIAPARIKSGAMNPFDVDLVKIYDATADSGAVITHWWKGDAPTWGLAGMPAKLCPYDLSVRCPVDDTLYVTWGCDQIMSPGSDSTFYYVILFNPDD